MQKKHSFGKKVNRVALSGILNTALSWLDSGNIEEARWRIKDAMDYLDGTKEMKFFGSARGCRCKCGSEE